MPTATLVTAMAQCTGAGVPGYLLRQAAAAGRARGDLSTAEWTLSNTHWEPAMPLVAPRSETLTELLDGAGWSGPSFGRVDVWTLLVSCPNVTGRGHLAPRLIAVQVAKVDR